MFPLLKTLESTRTLEAALSMHDSHDSLRGGLRTALHVAHGVTDSTDWNARPYISDVFPSHVVYHHSGSTFKRKYTAEEQGTGNPPKITLGDPKKVHMAYMDCAPSKESVGYLFDADLPEFKETVIITPPEGVDLVVAESGTFCGEVVDIREAAKKAAESGKPTTVPVCIIKPGWGSCAYYSKEMIAGTGPKVFKKGTQMFWNHATDSQESERPEGDLNDLAAVLTKDAYWDETGAKGPGLYSEAKVFSDYSTQVEEKGPYIGVSINAGIKAHEGSVEGRSGKIADAFVKAFSTDFVTKAGAGGAPIVPVTEAARVAPAQESTTMTDQEKQEMEALRADRDKAVRESESLRKEQTKVVAVGLVSAILHESGVSVKVGMIERVCESPRLTADGKIDPKWAEEVATDFIEAVGEGSGRVRGMGAGSSKTQAAAETETRKNLESSLKALGVPEAGLAYALEGGSR